MTSGGAHRVAETPRGWAFRADDGRLWRAKGIEKANGRGLSAWDAAQVSGWLHAWGFNTLGTACDKKINAAGLFATTEMIAISSWMRDKGVECLIDVNPASPCGPLANVFHPDFAAICDKAAKACCAPHRDDKNFLGYFLDNERNWWGCGNWWDCGLLDAAIEKLPPGHSARIAAERLLAEMPSSRIPDRATARRLYTEQVAERYFSTIVAAIRRHDPDHLVLGCRFAGVAGAPDVVWKICGRHCDVVTLNCYPTADIAKGELSLGVAPALLPKGVAKTGAWTPVPLETMLRKRFDVCGKPLFISEWSFRGGDVGRPRRESNGQQLADQRGRARAAALFLAEMERLPFMVGHAFYRWGDETFPAADGGAPETLNWGLVGQDARPHPEMSAAFRGARSTFGFHRLTQRDGRWMLLDAAGAPWKILAIEKANMAGPRCEARGNSHPYGDALRAAGVTHEEWLDRTATRLRDWGFNMTGTSCDGALRERGFAHAEMVAFGMRLAESADSEHWIRPWRGRCCEAFPNVFHPRFAEVCEEVAERAGARLRGDPTLLGYYLDNEMCWWGEGDWYKCGLLDYILKTLPDGHSARTEALRHIADFGYATAADYLAARETERDAARRQFTRIVAEKYFGIAAGALRKHDPDHLILGCRFAGVQGAADEVIEIAGRHCDVISFNCYPHADLTNRALMVDVHSRPLDAKRGAFRRENAERMFERINRIGGKPLFITEWTFIGLDAGLPCTEGTGHRLATQRERADAIALFLDMVNACPYMLGSEFFMWTDAPAEGATRAAPENCNYGLVNVRDEPYREVTEAFRMAKEKGVLK